MLKDVKCIKLLSTRYGYSAKKSLQAKNKFLKLQFLVFPRELTVWCSSSKTSSKHFIVYRQSVISCAKDKSQKL